MVNKTRLGLLGLSLVASARATKYGYNSVVVRKDTDIVAANFKDVEGVDLLSPAFLTPDTIPEGFSEGTKGPTDADILGELVKPPFSRQLLKENRFLCSRPGRQEQLVDLQQG